MNIRAQLIKEHSKANAELIRDYVINDKTAFDQLMEIFTTEDYRLNQRSAWVVGMLGDLKPDWFLPYFPQILECLENPIHDAISRNIYRTLQSFEIPSEYEGSLYDLCIRDLSNAKSAIAVKVFCMTVAFNISKKHPELKDELALVIEEQLPYGSKGFLSRSKKILKTLA